MSSVRTGIADQATQDGSRTVSTNIGAGGDFDRRPLTDAELDKVQGGNVADAARAVVQDFLIELQYNRIHAEFMYLKDH